MTAPSIPRARCLVLALVGLALGARIVQDNCGRAAAAASATPRARRACKGASGAVPSSAEGRRGVNLPRETGRGRHERGGCNGAPGFGRGMRG